MSTVRNTSWPHKLYFISNFTEFPDRNELIEITGPNQ